MDQAQVIINAIDKVLNEVIVPQLRLEMQAFIDERLYAVRREFKEEITRRRLPNNIAAEASEAWRRFIFSEMETIDKQMEEEFRAETNPDLDIPDGDADTPPE